MLAMLAATARADMIAVEHGRLMTLDIGGTLSTYYRFERDSAGYVTVEGPGRLTCLVRAIPPASGDTVAYTIMVGDGDSLLKTVQTSTEPIDWNWKNSDERVAKSRKFTLEVPEGTHRLRLELKHTRASAAGIRFILKRGALHSGESGVYPTGMAAAVSVVVKEKPLDYFLADAKTPVTITVVGPTRLRVVTRLMYTGLMKGPQRYSLDVTMDGHAEPAEALSTRKSLTTSIAQHPEWSSGESRTVYFAVPDGEHRLVLSLAGNDAPAVAMRFTIPEEDADNGSE